VLHGHAHAGSFEGRVGNGPVYNVGGPLIRRGFWVFELGREQRPPGPPDVRGKAPARAAGLAGESARPPVPLAVAIAVAVVPLARAVPVRRSGRSGGRRRRSREATLGGGSRVGDLAPVALELLGAVEVGQRVAAAAQLHQGVAEVVVRVRLVAEA